MLAACLLASVPVAGRAQSAAREYDVKATLLFNFSQFVEWPAESQIQDSPFVIGILGSDPFGKTLDRVIENERAHGRPIEIRRYSSIEDANADILFICASEASRVDTILTRLKGKPVLTVSDMSSRTFLGRGGMISLVSERNSIRLRIDPEAARSAGLTISAKVLQLAEIVSR